MLWIVWTICIGSLIFAGFLAKKLLSQDKGPKAMQDIADAIQQGAQAYLKRQFLTISLISLIIIGLIIGAYAFAGHLATGLRTAVAFVFGAVFSGIAGYLGMW